MEAYAKTHTGQVRRNNEDSYYITKDGLDLYIVADGMGGHKAGEVASHVAVESVKNYVNNEIEHACTPQEIEETILGAIRYANAEVYELAKNNVKMEGMGTTLTVLFAKDQFLYFGHVGDSRAYIYRNKTLQQVTKDHTLVGELVRAGTITEEQARVHPQKNIVTNAVGTDMIVKVDVLKKEINDEIILLCTDGLTNQLDEGMMVEIIEAHEDLSEMCNVLVDKANEMGGQDNITVVVVRCSLTDEGVNDR